MLQLRTKASLLLLIRRRRDGIVRELFASHVYAKALHHEQHTGDQREQSHDPNGNRQTKQEIQAKDDEEESEEEMSPGGGR